MDNKTEAQRRENMQHIRSVNTKPEEAVRKYLFAHGFRYRKNDKRYLGKPDIVLPKYRVIVFVHGCFWHQHKGCKYAAIPKSNEDYWLPKLEKNIARDKTAISKLIEDGWRVIIIWECAVKSKDRELSFERLAEMIRSKDISLTVAEIPAPLEAVECIPAN